MPSFDVAVLARSAAGNSAIRDIALSSVDGDILFVDGDLVFNFGADGIASDLKGRLQTFGPGKPPDGDAVEGEWFLDTTIGVDFLGKILRKSPNLSEVEKELLDETLATPGIVRATARAEALPARQGSVTIAATTDTGELLEAVGTQIQAPV